MPSKATKGPFLLGSRGVRRVWIRPAAGRRGSRRRPQSSEKGGLIALAYRDSVHAASRPRMSRRSGGVRMTPVQHGPGAVSESERVRHEADRLGRRIVVCRENVALSCINPPGVGRGSCSPVSTSDRQKVADDPHRHAPTVAGDGKAEAAVDLPAGAGLAAGLGRRRRPLLKQPSRGRKCACRQDGLPRLVEANWSA
jgi:hypothetical protein